MTHLPSYKSFNFHEVQEIENRVFCPHPAPNIHDLKVCPGSLNIEDEVHHNHNIHLHVHHSHWKKIQHNLSIIHPNKSNVPELLHINKEYNDEDDEYSLIESDEEIMLTECNAVFERQKSKYTKERRKFRVRSARCPDPENECDTKEKTTKCFSCKWLRKKRKR